MNERDYSSYTGLSPQALGVLRVNAAIQCAVLILLSLLVLFTPLELVFSLAIILLVVIICAVYFFKITVFRHRRYKYRITDDRIDIIEGVFFVSHTIVPVDRIHQVEIAFGPIDNKFGVAKVIVTTAGSRAVLRFLEREIAEQIAEGLNVMIKERLDAARGYSSGTGTASSLLNDVGGDAADGFGGEGNV